MKKFFLLICVLIPTSNLCFGQDLKINIFKDAKDYSEDKIGIEELEKKYGPLTGNNYFLDAKRKLVIDKTIDGDIAERAGVLAKSSTSKANITNWADGISSFLVSRAKKELSISFFNQFKTQINKDKYLDYRILLENTHNELSLIDEKVYDFQPYILSLKTKFKEDIKSLPANFNLVINNNNTQLGKFLEKNEKIKVPVSTVSSLISGLNQDQNFGVILENLTFVNLTDPSAIKIKNSIDLLRLFSLALRSDDPKLNYYISSIQMKELISNLKIQKTFLGLLTAVSTSYSSELSLNSKIYTELNKRHNEVGNTFIAIKKICNAISLIQNENPSDSLKLKDYFKGTSLFLGSILNLSEIIDEKDKGFIKFTSNLVKGSEIVYSIKAKEYTRSITLFASILSSYPFQGKSGNVVRFVNKYGMFIAQMADAKDRQQVEEALEYFAAPIGSWRDKSRDNFSLAIDSYIGLGNNAKVDTNRTFVSTPVGVSLNFSILRNKSSISLMGSVIDLGAITSFRFKDNDTQLAPIYLKQIFAPGLILSIQPYYKLPIFVNLGRQRNTSLSKIEANGNPSILTTNWRTLASLNMNIPITYILKR